jgi:hypothetical protein
MQNSARRRLLTLVLGSAFLLGACSHDHQASENAAAGSNDPINVLPANYKSDILGAMHAYLNDPTGIRDAGIAEPALKSVSNATRYVVCLRFNAKKHGKDYAGAKEVAAVFVAGRFDRFETSREPPRGSSHEPPPEASLQAPWREPPHDPCAGATYAPFPELEKLSR